MEGVVGSFAALGAVIAVGWVVGRLGVLGQNAGAVLSRLAFHVATPALLCTTLEQAHLRQVVSVSLVSTAGSTVVVAVVYAVLARALWRPAAPEIAAGALASSYVNAGNLGVPVAAYVLGDASYVAPVLLFQVLVMAPVGLALLRAGRAAVPGRSRWRAVTAPVRTPVVVGCALGLLLSASGQQLPGPVARPVALLAATAVPVALLAYGMSLHGAARPGSGEGAGQVWLAVGLKNLGQPAVGYALGRYGAGLHGAGLLGVTVTAALPTAQNVFVYTSAYNRGTALARDAVLLTTVLSVPVLLVVAAALG